MFNIIFGIIALILGGGGLGLSIAVKLGPIYIGISVGLMVLGVILIIVGAIDKYRRNQRELSTGGMTSSSKEKEKVESLTVIMDKAKQGDAIAQNEIGYIYAKGIGVKKDLELAFYWFKKSAEQGASIAQYNLAQMYYQGLGVNISYSKALYWFKKSAEQDWVPAYNQVGCCYYFGKGVIESNKTALYWFIKGAEKGDIIAQYNLGYFYENGLGGLKRSRSQALFWIKKSAAKGHKSAIELLKRIG